MSIELELLKLIFDTLDEIDITYPQLRDEVLQRICEIYSKDIVDVTNTYINYEWSSVDDTDGEELINLFCK